MNQSQGVIRATGSHGKEEYRFYEFPEGNPPGQIKAFVRAPEFPYEKRVPFKNLPTTSLQETFVALTGRSADEIGVTVMR